jgi:hypothetical protein
MHILVGLALLPVSAYLGAEVAPVLLVVPLWFIVLGVWLWRPSETLRRAMRSTHIVAAPFAVWIVAYGVFALVADRSAEESSGLLGVFGVIPIVVGILAAALSVWSLVAIRRWPSEQ